MNIANSRALAALVAACCLSAPLSGSVVLRRPGAFNSLSDALVGALRKAPIGGPVRVVDLSGDSVADGARVSRECAKETMVFTVGPEAAGAMANVNATSAVVAVGVPNPARLATNATYVSAYPALDRVMEFASVKLKAKRVALLHSPSQNREVATDFAKAAAARGLTLVPFAASSTGDLVRAVDGLAGVDVVLLAIDPLLFDRQALRFVVEKATAAKKPTVGFLPDLVGLGVTVALTTQPDAVAAAAVAKAPAARPGVRAFADAGSPFIIASRRSAELIGILVETLGAQQTR